MLIKADVKRVGHKIVTLEVRDCPAGVKVGSEIDLPRDIFRALLTRPLEIGEEIAVAIYTKGGKPDGPNYHK